MDAMRDDPLFKKLMSDVENIEEDYRVFSAHWRTFLVHDDELVRTVLRSHLIVEHFLDRYLAACNPAINEWQMARLSFSQKLFLADNPRTGVHFLMGALRRLNRIRNQLVHNLEVSLDDLRLEPIEQAISVWFTARGDDPAPVGLEAIRQLALFASGMMSGTASMIERHAPDTGLPGLLAWWQEKP